MSYSATVLADSPVGYWRLGDASGTSAIDSSGNSITGTYTVATNGSFTLGTTGLLAGDSDTAVTLTRGTSGGNGGYIDCTTNALLNVGDTFTLEAWIKLLAVDANVYTVFSKGANGYCVRINAGTVQLLKDQVAAIVSSTTAIADTNTHHIVATKAGATVKMYLDGVDVTGTVTNATCATTTVSMKIGTDWTSGLIAQNTGNFVIDEAAVYATALSSTRVSAHYTAGTTGGGAAPNDTAHNSGSAAPFLTVIGATA